MPINPETTARKSIGLPKETWERIRQYRFAKQFNTEAEAIRRLIERGLEVEAEDEAQ